MKQTMQLLELLCLDHELAGKIHARSLDLIEGTGVRFYSKRAQEILHGAGATVEENVVKIPAHVVEEALKKAPGRFTLYSRDGEHDLDIGGGTTYFSQDGCAAHALDFETGVRRGTRKEDIERMALISDFLDAVDVISPTVSAQDVPPAAISVHELEACFVHSGKHVLTESVTNAREARGQIELAATIAGGEDELRRRPIFSNFVCTISPLIQDKGGIDAALEFAAAGIAVGMYPMATTGVTAPVTLAATMAIVNAEVISALALLQIAVPGAPVFYSGGPATIDLRTGAYTATSPEAIWLRTMVARMAGYYGLPSIAGAGATSAKQPGAQAAWENTFSFTLPTLAGADMLFGLGLLDGSNLLAYEQIILDAEIAAMLRRLTTPVADGDEAFALDLIQETGPGGVYLDQQHTVTHMRQAISLPRISDRDSYDEWWDKGARSRVEVARQQVRQILGGHQPPPLPGGAREAMDEVLDAYAHPE